MYAWVSHTLEKGIQYLTRSCWWLTYRTAQWLEPGWPGTRDLGNNPVVLTLQLNAMCVYVIYDQGAGTVLSDCFLRCLRLHCACWTLYCVIAPVNPCSCSMRRTHICVYVVQFRASGFVMQRTKSLVFVLKYDQIRSSMI